MCMSNFLLSLQLDNILRNNALEDNVDFLGG